jgi:hypothetical protein
VPPKSRIADALAVVPDAKKAAAFLKRNGETDLAQAVRELVDYTVHAGQLHQNATAREAELSRNRPLQVHRDFRTHVNARRAKKTLPKVVVPYLERFVAGEWVPERPQRTAWESRDAKVNINLRVSDDLWDEVDRIAKDPEAVKDRGYKLTAIQVAIAALREEFGEPAEDTTSA